MKYILGTAQFGLNYGISNEAGMVLLAEAKNIVSEARMRGIDAFDTAIAYGESEKTLGQIGVGRSQVITKLSSPPLDCKAVGNWVLNQVDSSLGQLNSRSIYAMLLHDVACMSSPHALEIIGALNECQRLGKIKKIGISIYHPEQYFWAKDIFNFDIVQAPINPFDTRFLVSGVVKDCNLRGIEFHARSIFLQGLLLMQPDQRPKKFDFWNRDLEKFDQWIDITGTSRMSACLSFVTSLEGVDAVVFGVNSRLQLIELMDATLNESCPAFALQEGSDARLIDPSSWSSL